MSDLPGKGRRTAQPAEIKNAMRIYKRKNAMVFGSGAASPQDRGSFQEITQQSSNPYDFVNYLYRWQTYVKWYYKAWEARKIIDIPVDDAMRKPFELKGLDANDTKILMDAYEKLNGDRQFRRAQKQKRLLGGCILLPLVADGSKYWSLPLNLQNVQPGRGNFKALNLVDIQKITQLNLSNDPFLLDYDKPTSYSINGQDVHISRCIVFDGDPLLSMSSTNIYQLGRINPSGFNESVLTPIYDLLVRVTGSQQGAYHLINMASVLLAKVESLKDLSATNSKVMATLQQLMYNISIFNAGILEGKGVDITQHSATFGSVPELLMMFLQILSASCDIPATRFLGQAPGGLNATGESDLENYYNMIDSYQRMELKPRLRQLFDIIGCCQWGYEAWQTKKAKLDFNFPALWNLSEKEEAEKNEIIERTYVGLFDSNIINAQQLFDELSARKIFQTHIAFDTQLEELREKMQEQDEQGEGDIGLEGLKKAADGEGDEKKKTQVANAGFDDSEGKWVTVRGRHIFMEKGQSLEQALEKAGTGTPAKASTPQNDNLSKQIEKWFRDNPDRVSNFNKNRKISFKSRFGKQSLPLADKIRKNLMPEMRTAANDEFKKSYPDNPQEFIEKVSSEIHRNALTRKQEELLRQKAAEIGVLPNLNKAVESLKAEWDTAKAEGIAKAKAESEAIKKYIAENPTDKGKN